MKRSYKILFLCIWLPLYGMPQASLDSVIAAVRASNPELIASRVQMEADMKATRTGLYLPNPEVQFDYLWSDPTASGNRTDFGITQSFSFPTVYVQKSNQSGLLRSNASLSYLQKEKEVIHKATLAWLSLVGINKQITLIDHRLGLAEEIAGKAKTQLSGGEINVIRYHHAQMEFVNLKMERTKRVVEQNSMRIQMEQLCGGKSIPVMDTAYPPVTSWSMNDLAGALANSPSIGSLENEVRIRHLEKKIAVSEWLPTFNIGYYSETITGLKYKGVTTGISIPLFQNSNTVNTADLRMKTAIAEIDHVKSLKAAVITSLFNKREHLSAQVREIRSALLPIHDVSLLKKALDAGEINISEFYYECSVFYAAWSNLIHSELDLAMTEAELLFEVRK